MARRESLTFNLTIPSSYTRFKKRAHLHAKKLDGRLPDGHIRKGLFNPSASFSKQFPKVTRISNILEAQILRRMPFGSGAKQMRVEKMQREVAAAEAELALNTKLIELA